MWDVIKVLLTMGILVFLSVMDTRKKEIIPLFLLAPVIVEVIHLFRIREIPWIRICFSLLLLILFLLIGKVTEGGIGIGDAEVFAVIAFLCSPNETMWILLGAFLLSALVSGVCLTLKKANRKTTLPFLPFLTMAYGGVMLCVNIPLI